MVIIMSFQLKFYVTMRYTCVVCHTEEEWYSSLSTWCKWDFTVDTANLYPRNYIYIR